MPAKPKAKNSRQATAAPPQERLTWEDLEELLTPGQQAKYWFSPDHFCVFSRPDTFSNQWNPVPALPWKGLVYAPKAVLFFYLTGTWPDTEEARPHFWRLALSHVRQGEIYPLLAPDLMFPRQFALNLEVTATSKDDVWMARFVGRQMHHLLPENWLILSKDKNIVVEEAIKALRLLRTDHSETFKKLKQSKGLLDRDYPWWHHLAVGTWAKLPWEGDFSGVRMGTAGVPAFTPERRVGAPKPSVESLLGYPVGQYTGETPERPPIGPISEEDARAQQIAQAYVPPKKQRFTKEERATMAQLKILHDAREKSDREYDEYAKVWREEQRRANQTGEQP